MPVTLPKFVSPRVLSGVLNCGVLEMLKLSARNCKRHRSVNAKSLKMEKSSVRVGGEKLVWRPRFPSVKGAGAATAAVLNHSLN